jgi:hypothetical protein
MAHPSYQSDHDLESSKEFGRTLTPARSAVSIVDESIDAEAGFAEKESPVAVSIKDEAEDPGPPPNGGAKAWLQVLGSFFLFFNCW